MYDLEKMIREAFYAGMAYEMQREPDEDVHSAAQGYAEETLADLHEPSC